MKKLRKIFLKKVWFKFFAVKPRIRLRHKNRYRVYQWFDSDGVPIIRPNGLGFGLWGGNEKMAVKCLNNFK